MARIAKSLATLRSQIDAAYPQRSKSSDGWIGDSAHASRKSDHNPNSAGVVQALDLTHDPAHGFNSYTFAEHLRTTRQPRTKYVISNHKIFSSTGSNAWKWTSYSGSNPHDKHVHVSVSDSASLYDDPAQWNIGATMPPGPGPNPDADPILRLGDQGDAVKKMQGLLNQSGGTLVINGIFDSVTDVQVRAFQASRGLEDDGICGQYTWAELKIPTEPGMFHNITATVFGGKNDPNDSAYDGHPITDTEMSYALPARTNAGRLAHFYNRVANKSAQGACWDVGPWCTKDSYWLGSERPLAETCYLDKTPLPSGSGPNAGKVPTNPAGIDLTPGLAKALGIIGKGKVDWKFIEAVEVPAPPEVEVPIAPEVPVAPAEVPTVTIETKGAVKIIVNGKEVANG